MPVYLNQKHITYINIKYENFSYTKINTWIFERNIYKDESCGKTVKQRNIIFLLYNKYDFPQALSDKLKMIEMFRHPCFCSINIAW